MVGTVEDLGVGEAQRAQAGPGVSLIATEVHGLLGSGPVVAETVGLDDEAAVGPEEVDSMTAEATLRVGRRQAGIADDGEKATLERVGRPTECLRVEDRLQPTGAGAARLLIERRAESVGPDQVEPVGLVHGVFDFVRRQLGREVDEDGDRVGDGDAMDLSAATIPAPVRDDSGTAPMHIAGNGDVDGSVDGRPFRRR